MSTINGVLGPIDSADLGFTLMHEHVAVASAGFWQAWPERTPAAYNLVCLSATSSPMRRNG